MGPTRTLAAAGLRTLPRAGWRTGIDSAVAAVVGQPTLWLTGAVGFLLRGGFFVLLLPILTLPTPIDIRSMLGTGLGSAGFSPALVQTAALLGGLAVAVVIGGLFILAWLELGSYERLMADPETATQRDERSPRPLDGSSRRLTLAGLFAIQATALAVLVVAALPLLFAAIDVTYREILRPSSGALLYVRVLGGLAQPLFVLAAAMVVIEVLSATASRALLARRLAVGARALHRRRRDEVTRAVGGALRTLVTGVLGWSVTIALVVPAVWAISLVWQQVRVVLLLPGATGPHAGSLVVMLLLAAAWFAAIVLAGFASALRGAFWSMESLR